MRPSLSCKRLFEHLPWLTPRLQFYRQREREGHAAEASIAMPLCLVTCSFAGFALIVNAEWAPSKLPRFTSNAALKRPFAGHSMSLDSLG